MADPDRRRLAAKIAGLSLHAYGPSDEIAARARRGLEARFEREALEADPTLTGDALARKAALIRKLFYTRLAAASAKARATKRNGMAA